MNKIIVVTVMLFSGLLGACKKDKPVAENVYGNGPKTTVPASMQGNWMYGSFSMTEYWNQNPMEYIGNGLEMALAFKLNANGTYDQYFTYSTVSGGVATYHQSLTKGTIEINEGTKTLITHANWSHYKETKKGQTTADRDLTASEITKVTNYTYEEKTEPNGTKAIYMTMNGTPEALPFLQRF
ncbi:hypothetical protein [Chitinophaga eiseniae]|uniref:Uncharacterized protein n=1 Tax=Chitinophaga eiseniae TaxID=634771 RepID=A0A847SK94_9BACT|nr:hypothetical protein [Chitinophaga eiseniae]NLR80203.1 hypothetical protein [Chitinophaga eiseniae]